MRFTLRFLLLLSFLCVDENDDDKCDILCCILNYYLVTDQNKDIEPDLPCWNMLLGPLKLSIFNMDDQELESRNGVPNCTLT